MRSLAEANSARDPVRADVPPNPQPSRHQGLWGSPFATVPDPDELAARAQRQAEQDRRLEQSREEGRARELRANLCARGIVLTVEDDGSLAARPAYLLSDADREALRIAKPHLVALLSMAVVL